jgi:tetratricopeptide (TPR) repeat protein
VDCLLFSLPYKHTQKTKTMSLVTLYTESRQCTQSASPVLSITAFKVREKYEAGVRLLQSGHVVAAIQQFHEASFFDAEDALPIVALAECYIFLCDLRSAIRCYRRALWSLHKRQQRLTVHPFEGYEDGNIVTVAPTDEAPPLHPDNSPAFSSAIPHSPTQTASTTTPQPPLSQRPSTAQFSPPLPHLPDAMELAAATGNATPREGTAAGEESAEDAAVTATAAGTPTVDVAANTKKEVRRLSRSSRASSVSPQVAEVSLLIPGGRLRETGNASLLDVASHTSALQHELTASEVRRRLAGVLDALGLALFQVGSFEQALRCTTEALELLASADAQEEGEGGVGNHSCVRPATLPSPYLSEPIISLHRAVFLIALQREEEAEVLLGSHYEMFTSCRAQSAPLLIQLYCNRQAFRKARLLLESQDEGPQSAAPGETNVSPLPEENSEEEDPAMAETDEVDIGDRSRLAYPSLEEGKVEGGRKPAHETVTDEPLEVQPQPQPNAPAFPPLQTSSSLTVAKYIFTELYARYRSAALASGDEDSVTRCLDVYPNDVDLLFRRAQLRIAAGELKRSIPDLFRCVQDTNGEHKAAIEAMTTVLFTIGSSLDGESEVQNAVSYYSESLKWRPDNLLVLLARGDCYTKMEAFEDALADYEAILNYAPGHRQALGRIAALHDLWGRKFFALDDVARAEAEFTNAIKTDGTNAEFYYHRALCRLKLNQWQYALRDVLSCKELNPSAPHLRAFIARYMDPVQLNGGPVNEARPSASSLNMTARRITTSTNVAHVNGNRGVPAAKTGPAAKWYGSCTPPPPPTGESSASRASSRAKHNEEDANNRYATSSSSRANRSASASLPLISVRSSASSRKNAAAVADGWVQGCQTTLHRRQGESLPRVK